MTEEIIRTEFDLACGDRYRQEPKGDSSPTMPKWQEFEKQRRAERRKAKLKESKVTKEEPKQSSDTAEVAVSSQAETIEKQFTPYQQACIKALNGYYGKSLEKVRSIRRFVSRHLIGCAGCRTTTHRKPSLWLMNWTM